MPDNKQKIANRYRWLSDYYTELAQVTETGDEALIAMVKDKIEMTQDMIRKLEGSEDTIGNLKAQLAITREIIEAKEIQKQDVIIDANKRIKDLEEQIK